MLYFVHDNYTVYGLNDHNLGWLASRRTFKCYYAFYIGRAYTRGSVNRVYFRALESTTTTNSRRETISSDLETVDDRRSRPVLDKLSSQNVL